MPAVDLTQRLLELGPAGLICAVLWVALYKSEQREAKKDLRIQLLENQLRESYDERVSAADRLADALHGNARGSEAIVRTVEVLISEVRNNR